MEKIKKIMELLENDYGTEDNEKQVIAKKEIIEKLFLTVKMDPFNNMDDAKKVLKVIKQCQKIAKKNDLMDQLGDVLKFMETIVIEKLEINLKENPEPVLDKEEALEINNLLDDVTNLVNNLMKEVSKDRDTEEDKDYECDLAELPSNGKTDKPSGVRLSKFMEIAFIKNDNETVSLTATNLPSEISKKEFKKLIKYNGLWLDKKTVLKEGNHYMGIRLLYSKFHTTMLLADKNVKVKTDTGVINQKFVLVQKETVNGKSKLKIANFLNYAGMKVKDVVKSKDMRKFLKEVTFENDVNLVQDQYCIDDQNNFYRICIPFQRESK